MSKPSMPANHTHKSTAREHFDPNHHLLGVFKSHHSPEQMAVDAKMIAALIGPGIMVRDSRTGEMKLETERIYIPSRTRLEPIEAAEQGKPTCEIAGGWVTRQEAILELSNPTTVVELQASQPIERAA